jgi:hypothetical protein
MGQECKQNRFRDLLFSFPVKAEKGVLQEGLRKSVFT